MKSLVGKSVLVTRPKAQAEGLVTELEALGATVYAMPVIQIAPLESTGRLDEALTHLDRYDWIVLTSVNGVKAVAERLEALSIPSAKLGEKRLATIGPATAAELEKIARKPDLMPDEYVSEAIAAMFSSAGDSPAGKRFLLARADIARKDLANLLREQGAIVDEVAAYRIIRGEGTAELPKEAPDYITLTSSSAARGTYEILKENGHADWMERSAIVCIGPITSGTVHELGFEVAAEAKEYTVPGLVKVLMKHAQPNNPATSLGEETLHA
jgi:uroporphyrinogen-III synthase